MFKMTSFIVRITLVLKTTLIVCGIHALTFAPVVAEEDNSGSVCSIDQDRLQSSRERAKAYLDELIDIRRHCREGFWSPIVRLNMSDPLQQCPSAWREYNTSGVRACGRPVGNGFEYDECRSTTYTIKHKYGKVCGRVIGYRVYRVVAFAAGIYESIDGTYLDGVSITHGLPRNHIWSYAGGYTERDRDPRTCPCNSPYVLQPPFFVGDRYYCESTDIDYLYPGMLFTKDKLWDGEQCENEGTCCTTKSSPPSPPWFSVELANPTTDDIEIRICGTDHPYFGDTPIELLEIYVEYNI